MVFRNPAPVAAQVIWYEGSEVGFKFSNPADLDRIHLAWPMAAEPSRSRRSDAIGKGISNQTKRQEWEDLTKGIKDPEPI